MKRTVDSVKSDKERFVRQGFPEAVYCPGKDVNQIKTAITQLNGRLCPLLLTRLEPVIYYRLRKDYPDLKYFPVARLGILGKFLRQQGKQFIAIVTAGTADIPVAEEAALTAESLGNRVKRIFDVGVAGVHRVLNESQHLRKASCVVVCAGMEGALASVVGGLVRSPVIGVPTSVGYGSGLSGFVSLLTMLNSCAANVSVVNIDNGYSAGIIANLINQKG